MLTLNVNTYAQDRPIVTISGIATLTEVVTKDISGYATSYAQVSFGTTTISGLIDNLHVDMWEAAEPANNILKFNSVPNAYDTITISGITYTFIPMASGYSADNQVKLGATAWLTAYNFHKVLNCHGVSGTDYKAGQPIHPYVGSMFANNPLTLLARTEGTSGNAIEISISNSSAMTIMSPTFYGGSDAKPISIQQDIACTSVATTQLFPLSYGKQGINYEGLSYFSYSGLAAVNGSGIVTYWSLGPTNFVGRTALTEFCEVSGLTAHNLINNKVDSSGKLDMSWYDMSLFNESLTLSLASPNSSGTPTQNTKTYTIAELAQDPEYVIFVYNGSSAPERNWPRTTDANGTWYFAGTTRIPRASIHVNTSGIIGIWVGFGNKETWNDSVIPVRNYNSNFYLL